MAVFKIERAAASAVREVLREQEVTFTEKRPFPWGSVIFTATGESLQLAAVADRVREIEERIWWSLQW